MLRSKSGHTELSQGEVLVGRSRSCQVVLRDPSVSRSHALILVQGEALTVKDLASSNGTFVNGEKVEGEAELEAGDQLTFGETQLDLALLDREDAFSFAGLIEEVEFETAEARAFNPILETLKPRGAPSDDGEPELEIDGAPMEGVALTFEEPKLEPLEEGLFEDDPLEDALLEDWSSEDEIVAGEALPELPLEEAMAELDNLLSDEPDLPGKPETPRLPEPIRPRESVSTTSLPISLPPSRISRQDIAPSLGSGDVKMVVDRLLQQNEEAPKAAASVPSRDLGYLDETAEELLPSLDDLDELDALGTPPLMSTSGAHRAAATGPRAKAVVPIPPLAAPRTVGQLDRMPTPRAASSSLPPAGFGIRLLAAMLDGMLVMVVAGAISLLAGGPWLAEGGAVFFSVILGLSFVLHVFGWNLWGTTPAKRLFGLYVCPVGGEPGISVGSAVLRFLGYGVGALSLGLGFLMVAFTPGRRGLHDIISGTYVGRWQR